MPPPHFSIPRS
ncbi:hypothetical protein VN97_g12522, partial [Penicillium thymicola]